MVKRRRVGTQGGFTLIEMLVALAVFSLAALALLRLQGVTLSTTATLGEREMGRIVARNLAVEWLTDPGPPALGGMEGETENGGRMWHWTRMAAISDDPRIVTLTIRVRDARGGSPSQLVIERPAR